jgi:hypothetical protein
VKCTIILLLLCVLHAGSSDRIIGDHLVASGITLTIIIPDWNRSGRAATVSDSGYPWVKVAAKDKTGMPTETKPDTIEQERVKLRNPFEISPKMTNYTSECKSLDLLTL